MDAEYSALVNRIKYLDDLCKNSINSLKSEIEGKGFSIGDFYDVAKDKTAQLHRSDYDIKDVEYFREYFDVSKDHKKIKKAVWRRGKNFMFTRYEDDEVKEKERIELETLCNQYGVMENVKKSRKNTFNRFVKWYNGFHDKHPKIADMAVSMISFTYGDFMAQMAMKGSYELNDFLFLAIPAAYYSFEIPKALKFSYNPKQFINDIKKRLKGEQSKSEDVQEDKEYHIPLKEWLNPKQLIHNLGKRKKHVGEGRGTPGGCKGIVKERCLKVTKFTIHTI